MNLWWIIDNFYNKSPKLRKFIMRSLFGNRAISVTLFDTELMINSVKENGYYRASRLCNTSSLLRDEVSVILNIAGLLSENDTFVDIGANVGIFSSILSRYQKLFTDREIYAFEANPDTYKRLKINSEKYGFKAYNIGISDRECELEFLEGAVSHVFTTIENASKYNIKDKTIKVKCQRLDQFEIAGKSLVLKIDVEGQELQVLRGASSFFDEQRIKAVYLDGYSDKGVLDFLRGYNFSLWNGRKLVETDGDLFSLLAILPEKLPRKTILASSPLVQN